MRSRRRPAEKLDLNHLQLHVRNLDRARRFYESYFQFRELMSFGDMLFLRNAKGFDLTLGFAGKSDQPFLGLFAGSEGFFARNDRVGLFDFLNRHTKMRRGMMSHARA